MGAGLPERIFYLPQEIAEVWNVGVPEVWQWVMHGELRTHVWLPLMSVYEVKERNEGDRVILDRRLSHREGYTRVLPHHCRSVITRKQAGLREFANDNGSGRYILPDSAEEISIQLSELVILEEERARFEKRFNLRPTGQPSIECSGSPQPDFRHVRLHGEDNRFGEIQAAVLRQLYEAALSGEPWQSGKRLLERAGSQSFKISNVFKRNRVWRQLIDSDGRGHWRLSERAIAELRR